MLSDADFLEYTDLNYFIRHLLGQLSSVRQDAVNEFCDSYFKRVQSCHHVLGTEYSFISGCTYNRRAFVFCVNETLANFSTAEEFTLSEYQQLIELVCPDFPKHIVLEAAHAIDSKSATSAKVAKFTHYDLRIAVFGQIIFEEWLKQIEKFFREMSSSSSHTSTRLRGHIVECRRLLPITIEQPTVAVIDGIMSEAFSSHSMEISYDDFRRAMFSNSFFAAAVTKVPLNAQPIISAPPATSDEGTSY